MSQGHIKLTDHLHVAPHFAESKYPTPRGALNMLPSELGCLLKDMDWARESGRHQTHKITQATTTILLMSAKCGIRPTRQHRSSFMNRSRLAQSFIRAGQGALGRLWEAGAIFQGASILSAFRNLDQVIDTVNVNDLETIEIGREARQTSTDVRTGHRGQPKKLNKFAPANLKFVITQGSVSILPKRLRRCFWAKKIGEILLGDSRRSINFLDDVYSDLRKVIRLNLHRAKTSRRKLLHHLETVVFAASKKIVKMGGHNARRRATFTIHKKEAGIKL